jgi:hypothetical protein
LIFPLPHFLPASLPPSKSDMYLNLFFTLFHSFFVVVQFFFILYFCYRVTGKVRQNGDKSNFSPHSAAIVIVLLFRGKIPRRRNNSLNFRSSGKYNMSGKGKYFNSLRNHHSE